MFLCPAGTVQGGLSADADPGRDGCHGGRALLDNTSRRVLFLKLLLRLAMRLAVDIAGKRPFTFFFSLSFFLFLFRRRYLLVTSTRQLCAIAKKCLSTAVSTNTCTCSLTHNRDMWISTDGRPFGGVWGATSVYRVSQCQGNWSIFHANEPRGPKMWSQPRVTVSMGHRGNPTVGIGVSTVHNSY